ncbi:hypothetical protein MSPP1_003782 [Malassezia sp. CBS 17886]|nr:hypothetical protein MSPP1_003782 [Malassezia sp. CBS 17886]
MAELRDELQAVAQQSSVSERADEYGRVLMRVLRDPPAHALAGALDTFVELSVLDRSNTTGAGLIAGRAALQSFNALVRAAHDTPGHALVDAELYLGVVQSALAKASEHAMNLEHEIAQLRLLVADQLEDMHRWRDAAGTLQEVLVPSARLAQPDDALLLHVRLLRLFLRLDDLASADTIIKRASSLAHQASSARDDSALRSDHGASTVDTLAAFRGCQADIFDRQHRYMDASD